MSTAEKKSNAANNHISGRGVAGRLKAAHPGISILPLDLDPDTSYADHSKERVQREFTHFAEPKNGAQSERFR